jgi:hypothetical protein
MEHVIWCSGCSAEPAIDLLEIQWDDDWVSFPIGPECLAKAQEQGTIDKREE